MRKITLHRRPDVDSSHLPENLHPLLRKIYANRGITHENQLEKTLQNLLKPQQLHGIQQAVDLLVQTINAKQKIIIVGDFDADGATSTALTLLALRAFGVQHVDYLVPNRFDDGYGLSPEVVGQAKDKGAELILTVDNGISSHAGVETAHRHGIKVLVTDHHLPGETLPDADAIVNPNLKECQFASKSLAGVGVAFYLMSALRNALRQANWFTQNNLPEPNLADYLDLVALGTVADVVPLDSNNRILVHYGLQRIRFGRCRAGIHALLEIANRPAMQLTASDLGFIIGPRLNAAGRLDNMSVGVELLICDDMAIARQLAHDLDALNQTRKEIEQGMQAEALVLCDNFTSQAENIPYGLAIYHPEWHQGVIGILASRLKEKFHRPVIAFAPAGDGLLKGSGRSIQGLHMRDALERLDSQHPDLIVRFGGHAMAAGLSIYEEKLDTFQQHFQQLMEEWISPESLEGTIWTDGELTATQFNLDIAALIRDAGPWGQAFPEPLFDGRFKILQQRIVGSRHLKLLLEPLSGGPMVDGIAFNIDTQIWPDISIKFVNIAYTLDINEFRGNRNIQVMIKHIQPE